MTQGPAATFRRLVKNASWLLGANVLASAIAFAQSVMLGRALGTSGYGLLAIVIAATTIANQLLDIRLWETVIRFVGESHASGRHGEGRAFVKFALWVDAITGVVAFAVVYVIAPWVCEGWLGRPAATPLVRLYAVTLLTATLNHTLLGVLRVLDRFNWLATHRVTLQALRFLCIAAAIGRGGDLRAIVWMYVFTEIIGAVTLIALTRSACRTGLGAPGADQLALVRPRLAEFVRFTAHNVATSTLSLVSRHLDVLILAYFRVDAEVGIYRLARQFTQLFMRVTDPLYQALLPELVQIRQRGSVADVRQFIRHAMMRVAAITVPVLLLLVLVAPVIVVLVRPDFAPAVVAIRIMAIGVLAHALLLWARPLSLVLDRPQISSRAFAASALVLIAASLTLVPRFGLLGSAFTYVLTTCTAAGLTAYWARRASFALQPKH